MLKRKWPIIVLLVTGFILAGYFLNGEATPDEVAGMENKEKEAHLHQKKKSGEVSRTVATASSLNPENYLMNLRLHSEVDELYKKTSVLFEESPNKDDLATWISIGLVFDGSEEYGILLNRSLEKINKNPSENFALIEQVIKKLPPEESFLRGQLINLVNNMDLESEDKKSFFGSEMVRNVVLDSEGNFSPDSLNITTAMIMLKNSGTSKAEAEEFISESLQVNNDPEIREKLLVRFNAYFAD
ncbi:hypothetical protein [Peredibacter starrii]|uniref:Tetratricopeptide repeat protein n=1 Tax=Peredibacter starrii TaxID=28202 RepID=A0AAX4HKD5_9BACT|nr:hypothetical protein [Peredibacter starrii]WPU63660.1 hypothetical protein SOO65_13275 [Peredibacter starrii]